MSSGLNWAKADARGKLHQRPMAPAVKGGKGGFRPITAKQAAYLEALQKQLERPYTGASMSVGQARKAIDKCIRELHGDRPKQAPRRRPSGAQKRKAKKAITSADLKRALIVPCPRAGCGVDAGVPCVDRSGKRCTSHAARVRDADVRRGEAIGQAALHISIGGSWVDGGGREWVAARMEGGAVVMRREGREVAVPYPFRVLRDEWRPVENDESPDQAAGASFDRLSAVYPTALIERAVLQQHQQQHQQERQRPRQTSPRLLEPVQHDRVHGAAHKGRDQERDQDLRNVSVRRFTRSK